MNWKWNQTPSPDPEKVRLLSHTLAAGEPYPAVLAAWLLNRGIDDRDKAMAFMKPPAGQMHDPLRMADMQQACDRLLRALRQQEKVLLYGDYDVDGTTSVALMTLFFRDFGYEIPFYIPDRFKEGYGISFEGIDEAARQGIGLLIALDCGTRSHDKIRLAAVHGIDVIVCDHHQPGAEALPAAAFLNPLRPDCAYPEKGLSACGVAYKWVQALAPLLCRETGLYPEGYDPDARFLDLLTLSVCCDLVPITGENRAWVRHGLEKIRTNPLPGIAALMRTVEGPAREWDVEDLVFALGPRINSAGRLDHARDAVHLLLGDAATQQKLAEHLTTRNTDRQHLDRSITAEALDMLAAPEEAGRSATVLWNESWNKGIIGISASRLIETCYRPTLLLTRSEGYWTGSGRSVQGFDLHAALQACAEHTVQFGGHKYAAGITLKESQLLDFKAAFEAYTAAHILPEQKQPVLEIAGEMDFTYLNAKFIRLLKWLGPFGPGNEAPVLMTRKVELRDARVLREQHLRLQVLHSGVLLEAIGFGLADRWREVQHAQYLDITWRPEFKTWKNHTYIQLRLKDIRESV